MALLRLVSPGSQSFASSLRLANLGERRLERFDLAVETPDKPAIDHLGPVDMRDPAVSMLLDSDASIIRDHERMCASAR
ncbi:hypothetical protein [Hyphomicrobium facile]|uniref:hypothetical protein n=1 Tax=Hyphomicrobium facile TaxID=51670 RepID=UPI001FCCC1AF|nr:hypothetical protein [Hyphomicrobium facile]